MVMRYEDSRGGLDAAARHCDTLRALAEALEGMPAAEAIDYVTGSFGMTQADLAKLCGIQKSRLSEMKRKRALTRQDRATLIAAYVLWRIV